MKRVYVAGPYNAPDVIGVLRNMRVGIKACVKLLQEYNVAPFCPWIDYQFSLQEEIPLEKYWEYSMAWLLAADAVYLLPYWWKSPGSIQEIEEAKANGIPVFEDMGALEDWLRTQDRIERVTESVNREGE